MSRTESSRRRGPARRRRRRPPPARGRRRTRLVEATRAAPSCVGFDPGGRGARVVADLDRAANGRPAGTRVQPAHVADAQPIAAQAIARPDPNLTGRGIDAQHEPRRAAPPGTPRRWPTVNAWVPAWPPSARRSCRRRCRRPRPAPPCALEEADVVAVGDEAESPVNRACRRWAGRSRRASARTSSLRHVAEREADPRQQLRAARRTGSTTDPCRVARAPSRRRRRARARCARSVRSRARRRRPRGERQQRPELEPLVAADAGVRRSARRDTRDEVVDHRRR